MKSIIDLTKNVTTQTYWKSEIHSDLLDRSVITRSDSYFEIVKNLKAGDVVLVLSEMKRTITTRIIWITDIEERTRNNHCYLSVTFTGVENAGKFGRDHFCLDNKAEYGVKGVKVLGNVNRAEPRINPGPNFLRYNPGYDLA